MSLDVQELIKDIKSVYERLNTIAEPYPPYKCVYPHKSFKSARRFFSFGKNLESLKNRSFEALWSYTLSIANAPDDSCELHQSYYERALLFFKLSDPKSAMLDINRCLKGSREPELLALAKEAKNMCLKDLNLPSDTNTEIYDDYWNNSIVNFRLPCREIFAKHKHMENPLLPKASIKVTLAYSEKRGKHMRANQFIIPGDILIVEECYVASAQGGAGMYCDFCLMLCYGLIPCHLCTVAMYCSDRCRERAYYLYHRMECELLRNAYSGYTMADATAVRMFLLGTDQGAQLPSLMADLSISDILEGNFNFTGKVFSRDYRTALRLLAGPIDPTFLKSRVEDACKIINLLYEMDFFLHVAEDELEVARIFATALLLNNYAVQRQNELNVIKCTTRVRRETRGLCDGLMLTMSMLQHSCHPNVAIYRQGRDFVVYSLRPIEKDVPIFFGFCDSFENAPIGTRHEQLNSTCHCVACTRRWPSFFESGLYHQEPCSRALTLLRGDLGLRIKSEYYSQLVELAKFASFFLEKKILERCGTRRMLQIITRINYNLYTFMRATAFPVFQMRQLLVIFMEKFFEQQEPDINSWSFPDYLQTTNTFDVPKYFTLEDVYLLAMDRLYRAINKLHLIISYDFVKPDTKYYWNNYYHKSYPRY